jgi:hypothetical protein
MSAKKSRRRMPITNVWPCLGRWHAPMVSRGKLPIRTIRMRGWRPQTQIPRSQQPLRKIRAAAMVAATLPCGTMGQDMATRLMALRIMAIGTTRPRRRMRMASGRPWRSARFQATGTCASAYPDQNIRSCGIRKWKRSGAPNLKANHGLDLSPKPSGAWRC